MATLMTCKNCGVVCSEVRCPKCGEPTSMLIHNNLDTNMFLSLVETYIPETINDVKLKSAVEFCYRSDNFGVTVLKVAIYASYNDNNSLHKGFDYAFSDYNLNDDTYIEFSKERIIDSTIKLVSEFILWINKLDEQYKQE